MTENDAIAKFKRTSVLWESATNTEMVEAVKVAIQALEEIQQYRAIGTVEQLEWCKDASHWKELFKEKLEQYEAIGTVEELKKLREAKPKEIPIARISINKKGLRELVGEKLKEIELDIQAIRNEAIDDFVDSLDKYTQENWVEHQEYGITWNDIERIAEQLKKGVEE